jgi:streptogramin lyase
MDQPLDRQAQIVKDWLAEVRGPDSPDLPHIKPFPRPTGRAKRAIVTEYELPWTAVNIHDVTGDKEGNIWFSVNKSPFIGKLEPSTGKITSYRVPKPPPWDMKWSRAYKTSEEIGVYPGIHWIQADHNSGLIWYSDTWAGALGKFDPKTEKFEQVHTGTHGNVGLSRDGKTLWKIQDKSVQRFDAATVMKTGLPDKTIPLTRVSGTYGTCIAWDDRTVGGGGGGGLGVWYDIQTGEAREVPGLTDWADGGRCDFDPQGNLWTGSKSGPLLKYNPKTNVISQYEAPTKFTSFYGARSDKNGEIWVGLMHGGRVGRFNQKTQEWTEYVLPSVYSFDFFNYVDNTTNPVTYWYGDQFGYIVRVQPLD